MQTVLPSIIYVLFIECVNLQDKTCTREEQSDIGQDFIFIRHYSRFAEVSLVRHDAEDMPMTILYYKNISAVVEMLR